MTSFQRARTADQRAIRTSEILAAARSLLDEGALDEVTLNAIARTAGLAASNVLRYFDSREAVLLQLVVEETELWLDDLGEQHVEAPWDVEVRCRDAARAVAGALDRHPRFCELISVQAVVLERRISDETAVRFKSVSLAQLRRLSEWLAAALPEIGEANDPAVLRLAARSILVAGALWAQSRPSASLTAQLAEHPELTPLGQPFPDGVRETLGLLFRGASIA